MRTPALCLLVATLVMVASPSAAFAHGGVYRGPGSSVPPGLRGAQDPAPPPPPPTCSCASHACPDCTTDTQRGRKDLALATREIREVQRMGDLRELEVTIRLRATKGKARREAVVPLALGPLCWVTGASLEKGALRLTAARADRKSAVERYRETIRRLIDPLIVLRAGAGRLDVRAWPVTEDGETVARLRVFAFANEPSRRTRLYREGEHVLAVVPKADFEALDLDAIDTEGCAIHPDRANGRAFVFLPWHENDKGQHAVFPDAPVHPVRQLEPVRRFLFGTGDSAMLALEPAPAPTRAPRTPSVAPPPPEQPAATQPAPPPAEVTASR